MPQDNIATLEPTACLGFNGTVPNGLVAVEVDDEAFVAYPLGGMVVVQHATRRDGVCFLRGHTEDVTCVAASNDGRVLCTGQDAPLGVASPAVLWDLEDACDRILRPREDAEPPKPLKILNQHVSGVRAVGFNCDDSILFTMGARDDNKICLWEMPTAEPKVCVRAALDTARCGAFLRNDPFRLVTGGKAHVKVWRIEPGTYKVHDLDVKVGKLIRVVDCVTISGDDNYALCGTQSGEVIQVNINRDPIKDYNEPDAIVPKLVQVSRGRHSGGVKAICCLPGASKDNVDVVCAGGGDGSLTFYSPDLRQFKRWACDVDGPVTSLSATSREGKLSGYAVGTSTGNRYTLAIGGTPKLRGTSHVGAVFDVCYPAYSSRVFATCAVEDIRVWDARSKSELVRIRVPNLECRAIAITASGATLVSGWSDGKVRAFGPETGKLTWVMADAHDLNNNGGPMDCTALEVVPEGMAEDPSSDEPWRLLSGGVDGRVRVWRVTRQHRAMLSSTKEHRGAVTCLKVTSDLRQFISASTDGNCLVWDLRRYTRVANLFEATCYRSCFYLPDASQIVTTGSNCKVTFWEAVGCDAIREVRGGPVEMTALACSTSGNHFVSGSRDSRLRLWDYDGGIYVAEGAAHSGAINKVAMAPNQRVCVTAGSEGGVMLWPLPDEVAGPDEDDE